MFNPVAKGKYAPSMMYRSDKTNAAGFVECGDGERYQTQVQRSLNSRIVLLYPSTVADLAHDPGLSALAEEVNLLFQARAMALLTLKRAELVAKGMGDVARRLEVTVLLTENGLQLAFSQALARKECAPVPRKSLARRVLGPLYPGRKFWVMPESEDDAPQDSPPEGPVATLAKALPVDLPAKAAKATTVAKGAPKTALPAKAPAVPKAPLPEKATAPKGTVRKVAKKAGKRT